MASAIYERETCATVPPNVVFYFVGWGGGTVTRRWTRLYKDGVRVLDVCSVSA